MEHHSFFSWTLFWSFVNFAILVGLLAFFARKPLKEFFINRHRKVKEEIEEAERLKREAEKRYQEHQERVAALGKELEEMRNSFKEEREKERGMILEEAERSGRRIRNEAQGIAEGEVQRVKKLLQEEAAELTVKVAGDILKKEIGHEDQEGMIVGSLPRRYARALFSLSKEEGVLEEIERELGQFAGLWESEEELQSMISSPVVQLREKVALVGKITESLKLSPVLGDFLRLLTAKGRLTIIAEISRAFEQLIDQEKGRLRAVLTSAVPLPGQTIEKIKVTLEKVLGKEISLRVDEDPELIGGAVARVGSLVFDGSVKTKLKQMESKLKQVEG
jgi:F-type H+-transporting ATPase subunit delta